MDGPNLSPNPEKLNFFKIEPTDRLKIPNFKVKFDSTLAILLKIMRVPCKKKKTKW